MSAENLLYLADTTGHVRSLPAAALPFSSREEPNPLARLMFNMRSLTSDFLGHRLAVSYRFANRVDFISVDGRSLTSVADPRRTRRPDFRVTKRGIVWRSGTHLAYAAAIAASDRYVYAVFCGCTEEERDRAEQPRLVHVYSWNGPFVAELSLHRAVTAITVTQDDRLLYGALRGQYPLIGEWVLPFASQERPLTVSDPSTQTKPASARAGEK